MGTWTSRDSAFNALHPLRSLKNEGDWFDSIRRLTSPALTSGNVSRRDAYDGAEAEVDMVRCRREEVEEEMMAERIVGWSVEWMERDVRWKGRTREVSLGMTASVVRRFRLLSPVRSHRQFPSGRRINHNSPPSPSSTSILQLNLPKSLITNSFNPLQRLTTLSAVMLEMPFPPAPPTDTPLKHRLLVAYSCQFASASPLALAGGREERRKLWA
jgi:hypothetical protein